MSIFNFGITKKESELNKCLEYIRYLYANGDKIKICKRRKARTLNQNAYLHVILTFIGSEIGYTMDEMKQVFKDKYLSYYKNGKRFVKRTRDLDTKEMTTFINKIRNYSSAELMVYVPEPHESEKLEILKRELEIYEQYAI